MNRALLIEEIEKLSIEDRLELVGVIWDSISVAPDSIPLTDAQKKELDRRREKYRDNPTEGYSWEEVRQRL